MNAIEDIIITGPNHEWHHDRKLGSRAWRISNADIIFNPDDARSAAWLVEAPWAHPVWHSYSVTLLRLANINPAHRLLYLDNATHEIQVAALDPSVPRQPQVDSGDFAQLSPMNFCAQFIAPTDDNALHRVQRTVIAIVNGKLSPDTDFRDSWISLYGDNMVKESERRTVSKIPELGMGFQESIKPEATSVDDFYRTVAHAILARPLPWEQLRIVLETCMHYATFMLPESITEDHKANAILAVVRDGHARNVAAGWWTDLDTGIRKTRNTGELLMLAVSELCEIDPNGLFDIMDDKLPHRIMFEVEIADFLIRLFDTTGALCPDIGPCFAYHCEHFEFAMNVPWTPMTNDIYLMDLARSVAAAMEGDRKKAKLDLAAGTAPNGLGGGKIISLKVPALDFYLARAIVGAMRLSSRAGLNVTDAVLEKMEFNANRLDHTKESRQAEGGKAY
jgi:hypothetical protein